MPGDDSLILVIEDQPDHRQSLVEILGFHGYRTLEAADGLTGIRLLEQEDPDLALLDLKLPDMDGLEVLRWVRANTPEVPVVLISGYGTVPAAVEATKLGAIDFLEKPLRAERVLFTIEKALRERRLRWERNRLLENVRSQYPIVGKSEALQQVISLVKRAAACDSRVLITGESGTGKELVAKAIHHNSARAAGPFVPVNCAAIPQGLIESELFGHRKGAFTGAHANRPGSFVLADHGTLFLDEVGDMDPMVQAKVLRALDDGFVQPVGGNHPVRVDVRIIAATNRSLKDDVQKGRFREDLFYRLDVLNIHIPPLRERREDIVPLIDFFLSRFCDDHKVPKKKIEADALSVLIDYDWPGNVRELRNVVEKLVVLTDAELIRRTQVATVLGLDTRERGHFRPLREARQEFERDYILKALIANNWHITRTAQQLDIERTYLWKIMRKFGISRQRSATR